MSSVRSGRKEAGVGDRVIAGGKKGVVRFKGETQFAAGQWVGIELDTAEGKNDGSVAGVRYFTCQPNFGLFVKSSMIKLDEEETNAAAPTATAAAAVKPKTSSASAASPSSKVASSVRRDSSASASSAARPAAASRLTASKTTLASRSTSASSLAKKPPASSTARSTFASSSSAAAAAPNSSASPDPEASPEPEPESTEPLDGEPEAAEEGLLDGDDDLGVDQPAIEEPQNEAEQNEVEQTTAEATATPAPAPVSTPAPTSTPTPAPAPVVAPISSPSPAPTIAPVSTPAPAPVVEKAQPAPAPAPASAPTPASTPAPVVSRPAAAAPAVAASPAPIVSSGVSLDEHRSVKNELSKARNQIEALKSELAQLKAEQSSSGDRDTEISNLQGMVEMLTLDKALAEEQVEELTNEVEAIKEKLKNAQVELQSFKASQSASKEEMMRSLSSDEADMVKLMEQNKQLTIALKQLRDVSVSDKQKLTAAVARLEKENQELAGLQEEVKALRKAKEKADKEIAGLKEALDEASEYERLTEQLTEKNLALNEQIEKLNSNVTYLQSLNEASEEVEEGHIELENQLQQELQNKDIEIQDITLKLKYKQQQNEDQVKTIRQFRELVRTLEADQKQLREQQMISSAAASGGGGREVFGVSLNKTTQLLLQNRVKEVRSQRLEKELQRIEAEQFKRRADFVSLYVPENISIDERSLLFVSLLDRIKSKCELLMALFHEFYGLGAQSNLGHSASQSQWNSLVRQAPELSQLAYSASEILLECVRVCEFLQFAIQRCESSAFNNAAGRAKDLIPVEVVLDGFVSMIQQDSFNESSSVHALVQAIQNLEQFARFHLNVVHLNFPNAEDGHVWLRIPFSVTLFHSMKKYSGASESSPQLESLLASLDSKSFSVSFDHPINFSIDSRLILQKNFSTRLVLEQLSELIQSLKSAKREGMRKEAEKNKSLAVENAEDEEEFEKWFAELEEAQLNGQQICSQLISNARAFESAVKASEANQKKVNEIGRLIALSLIRVHRVQSQASALSARIRSVITSESLSEVRQHFSPEKFQSVSDSLNQVLIAELRADANPDAAGHQSLLYELNQSKAALLEISRLMIVDETVSNGNSDALPDPLPADSHAVHTRSQLQQAAQTRIQLQEMNGKLAEKQRELLGYKTTNSELLSKLTILQQKIAALQSKAEGSEELKNKLGVLQGKEDELKTELAKNVAELDNANRENKALRKQLLKLKHKVLKQGEEGAATGAAGGSFLPSSGGSGGGANSEDFALLERTVRALRSELAQERARHGAEALRFALPPLPDVRPAKPVDSDSARQLRDSLISLTSKVESFRVSSKIVNLCKPAPAIPTSEAEEMKLKELADQSAFSPLSLASSVKKTPLQQFLSSFATVQQFDKAAEKLRRDMELFEEKSLQPEIRCLYSAIPALTGAVNVRKIGL